MADGDVIKLGTFYLNGTKQARPTYPWQNGSTPSSAPGAGNIPTYSSGNIEIKDTDSNDAYKINWIEVNDGGGKLLIADRNLLVSVSWDTLNSQGLISGKNIIIDGQQYKLRLLTGGSNYRNGNYDGGTPNNNEWDRIICNEGGFSDLPTPNSSDLDTNTNETDRVGTHNGKWNWYCCYSWVQETYSPNASYRVIRGCSSARYLSHSDINYANNNVGWRPALEVLNSAPLISDNNRDLGNYASALVKNYTISDSDGDKISIVEKLDNSVIKRLDNQSSSGDYILDLSSKWSNLSLGKHNVTIEATDLKGAISTRTWTFTKTNSAPGKPQIINLKNNIRLPEDFNIEFQISSDPEGDVQKIKAQVADDSNFNRNIKEFLFEQELSNKDSGKSFKIKISGIEKNTTKYVRVGSTDLGSNTTSWSEFVEIKIGNILEVQTLPSKTQFYPSTIILKDKTTVDSKATAVVYACNNALDKTPAWEDITVAYKRNEAYEFINKFKTADTWAVSVRYVINANDATGEISIESIGVGVN